MDMTGEYIIAAPRAKVWSALNDPEILKQCIPGCQEMLRRAPTPRFAAKVQARVGPVSASFSGKVTLSDLDPPNGCRIIGEGTGGAAGFAKGGATVQLADEGDGTKLTYKVEAQIGGKLAQIGSRLIDGAARKMADDFFSKFAALVGAARRPRPCPSRHAARRARAPSADPGAELAHTPGGPPPAAFPVGDHPGGAGGGHSLFLRPLTLDGGVLLAENLGP